MKLEPPFDSFKLEKRAGEYKDFGTASSDYPLKGVTYPVDYGEIEGYVTEDGANLDLFVGSSINVDHYGYVRVARPDLADGEHKFYIHLTDDEEAAVLREFNAVLIAHGRFDTVDALLMAMEPFRTT
jgi:hypothetical protein